MGEHSHGQAATHTDQHSHGHVHSHGEGHSHGHGHGHTHDKIDWATQVTELRREDSMAAAANAETARRLIGAAPDQATVIDIGAGAGGQSVAFARELLARGGGRLVISDAVPELLEAAAGSVREALGGDASVSVETVLADAAADDFAAKLPAADLIWASRMVHHLPDQQAGVARFAGLLRPGGQLALAEGGLPTRYLPWDLGLGAPGLQDRLLAVRDAGFALMREDITAATPMPYGWNVALSRAGLREVTSFSVLTDHPAPPSPEVAASVVAWLTVLRERVGDRLAASDHVTLDALLDANADTYVGARQDIYTLGVTTIFVGVR